MTAPKNGTLEFFPRLMHRTLRSLLPWIVALALLAIWEAVVRAGFFHASAIPSPAEAAAALVAEIRNGRLFNDVMASLFRELAGFGLAAALGVPVGLVLGRQATARAAFLPSLNFFRNLSPLAWMPFAILWFGVGDVPAIFLIFLAGVFPIALATLVAVQEVPSRYIRVAIEFGMQPSEVLWKVTLPAILPQVLTSLRVTAGLCWLVLVAAEMIAGRDGVGFAVMDARNGLRTDILVAEMIVIGTIGILIDRMLSRLANVPSVRWGYER
jgi:NitT/TauT family transport system permease protein